LCFGGNKLIKFIVPKHNGMDNTKKNQIPSPCSVKSTHFHFSVNAQRLPMVYLTTRSAPPVIRNPTIHDPRIINREGRAGKRLWYILS